MCYVSIPRIQPLYAAWPRLDTICNSVMKSIVELRVDLLAGFFMKYGWVAQNSAEPKKRVNLEIRLSTNNVGSNVAGEPEANSSLEITIHLINY